MILLKTIDTQSTYFYVYYMWRKREKVTAEMLYNNRNEGFNYLNNFLNINDSSWNYWQYLNCLF